MIHGGHEDDIIVGGYGEDELYGNQGTDIIMGDNVEILFYSQSPLDVTGDADSAGYFWNVPMQIESISCDYGSNDEIYGGNDTDYIIAGALDDYVDSGSGDDLVFGDHARVVLYEDTPYKLRFATIADPDCAKGSDNITLGDGHDIAFGGTRFGSYCAGAFALTRNTDVISFLLLKLRRSSRGSY